MNSDTRLIFEAYENGVSPAGDGTPTPPNFYKAQYMASDGFKKWKTFKGPKAEEQLKAWIKEWVGDGEISDDFNYIVSGDGVGRIHVQGLPRGGLRKLLTGKEPPKLQGYDYVNTLVKTALKLFLPGLLELPIMKTEKTYGGTGASFIWNFKRPEMEKRNTIKLYSGKEFTTSRPTPNGRLVMHFYEDEYSQDGYLSCGVSLFYTGQNWDQVRVLDKHGSPVLTGDREKDLALIEPYFKDPALTEITEWLKANYGPKQLTESVISESLGIRTREKIQRDIDYLEKAIQKAIQRNEPKEWIESYKQEIEEFKAELLNAKSYNEMDKPAHLRFILYGSGSGTVYGVSRAKSLAEAWNELKKLISNTKKVEQFKDYWVISSSMGDEGNFVVLDTQSSNPEVQREMEDLNLFKYAQEWLDQNKTQEGNEQSFSESKKLS